MDWNELKTRWQAHRGHLEHHWQRISEREFDEIAGDRQRLSERIQQVYRVSPDEAEREIAAWEMEHSNFDPSSADGPPPVAPGELARTSAGAASAQGADRLVDTGTYPEQPADGAGSTGYMDDESTPELNEHPSDAPGGSRPRKPAR